MRLFLLTLFTKYTNLLRKLILNSGLFLYGLHEFLDLALVMTHHLLMILLQERQFDLHHRHTFIIPCTLSRVVFLLPYLF